MSASAFGCEGTPHHHLDRSDAIELVTLREFLAGWLDADLDYTRAGRPLYGTYTVEDLRADTARLLSSIKRANVAP